jgi:hypothetical protein
MGRENELSGVEEAAESLLRTMERLQAELARLHQGAGESIGDLPLGVDAVPTG